MILSKIHSLIIISVVVFTVSSFPVSAQQTTSKRTLSEIPQLHNSFTNYNPSAFQLGLQFGSAALFGSTSGVLGGIGSIALFAPNTQGTGGLAAFGYGVMGFLITYPLGAGLGTYIVANSQTYDASYGKILLGNTIGISLGVGTIVLTNGSPLSFALAFSSTIIGGMIANHLSINKKRKKKAALFNISKNNITLSAPSAQLEQFTDYTFSQNSINTFYSPTVTLLNISL